MALPQPQIPHQQHHHARQLSRLNINAASFNPGGPETALFTPHGFPTAGPQSAFPFSANPMQQQQQHLQQRQMGHHGSHPSMSMSMHRSRPSLANIPGFMPPMSAVPMTAGPHMANFPVNGFPVPPTPGGSQQQFPNQQPPHPQPYRQRRQQSISIGGPPRAALGGPQRKATTPVPAAATSTVVEGKVRKIVVKLPKETIEDEPTEQDQEGNPVASSSRSRPTWARYPIPPNSLPEHSLQAPPQIASVEIYPSHSPEEEGGDSAESTAAATVILPRRVSNNSLYRHLRTWRMLSLSPSSHIECLGRLPQKHYRGKTCETRSGALRLPWSRPCTASQSVAASSTRSPP